MNFWTVIAIFTTTSLIAGCTDPPDNLAGVKVKEVRPEQPAVISFARRYELIRDSRIALIGSGDLERIVFSRYQGVIFVDSESGHLSPRNHRIIIDTRSGSIDEDVEVTLDAPNYLTILIESAVIDESTKLYECKGKVILGEKTADVEFEAKTNVESERLTFEWRIGGLSETFSDLPINDFGRLHSIEVIGAARSSGEGPQVLQQSQLHGQYSSADERPSVPKPKGAQELKNQFSWKAAVPTSKKERINGLLLRFDKNDDNKISKNEVGQYWSLMEAGDINGDGSLSGEELKSVRLPLETVGE